MIELSNIQHLFKKKNEESVINHKETSDNDNKGFKLNKI